MMTQCLKTLMTLAIPLIVVSAWTIHPAFADEKRPLVITLQNHLFNPTEVHIPANTKAVILVKNLDATAEEFESGALKIEKVIVGHGEGIIHIRPTQHGHYTFVGEYHEKIARGVIIVD